MIPQISGFKKSFEFVLIICFPDYNYYIIYKKIRKNKTENKNNL